MKTALAWKAGCSTDTGNHRPNNEDRVHVDSERGVFLVVDGIGGHAGGEIAAEIAVEVLARELSPNANPLEDQIRRAITLANNAIFQAAGNGGAPAGMACVLTLAVVHDGTLTMGHVGDSRLYLIWNGTVRKITSDHSPVGELEDLGALTERQAMAHPRRNEVFRDVGSHERSLDDDFVETRSIPLHPAAALLLCSDGLSDALTSSQIGEIIESYDGDADRVAEALVHAANDAGGRDNVSVVFIAGPEFVGLASPGAQDARARHAVTRPRRMRWTWRWLGSRLLWLAIGILLGMALWILVERVGGFHL